MVENIIERMIKIDLHTHSLISGHAINTVYELASEASKRGISYLGITEHGPAMKGAPHEDYFWISEQIDILYDVNILLGIEANILNVNGEIDLREDLLIKQKIVSAGLHDKTPYKGLTVRDNTESLINAMQNPRIKIITHPFRTEFPVEMKRIVRSSYETGTLLEINNQLFSRNINELKILVKNYGIMVSECKKYGIPIVLGSDAHVASKIGDFTKILSLSKSLGLCEEMIINYDEVTLLKILGE